MQAVYGGKTRSEVKKVVIPKVEQSGKNVQIQADENTGELLSIKVEGREILRSPMRLNITRYIDNEMKLVRGREIAYGLRDCKPYILESKNEGNRYEFKGVLAIPTRTPAVAFTIVYEVNGSSLKVEVEYTVAEYIKHLPRFGLEFAVDKNKCNFSYVGFGPYESYVDKNVACEYGYYESNAKANYDENYVRPQESGSHYHSEYLCVDGCFALLADKPFSFSVNPYTTAQLRDTTHAYALKENDFVNVCIDLAMRGVGSHSCGPMLDEQYEIPKQGKNTFVFTWL